MADETKEAQTPEEKRLQLEATTDTDSETLRKRETEERTLLNSWGTPVLAPNYWTYDDIGQWNEMTNSGEVGKDLEIVSLLDFVTEAAKVINGDEPLDYINSLDYMTLPNRIVSMEQLVAEEKEHRRSAYEYFQNEAQKHQSNTIEIESEEEFNRWEEALDDTENNPEELYRAVHGAPKSVGETIDGGIEQTQANGGMSEEAMEAERAAQENPRPDYLDEHGNPHWFDEEEETEILSDEEIEWLKMQEYYNRFAKETEGRSEEIQLQKAIELALEKSTVQLQEIRLNRENWNKLFPNGIVETPIGTVKLGENQFQKLQKSDRDNLLAAMYETLSNPAIVLEKETLDEKTGEFRPVNVYGKSFVREGSDHKKAVESVIIFKDGENISIGTHNKELGRFTRQIKTADQIIFADSEVSRVASLVLEHGGSHVQLKGINTQALNSEYDKSNLLSIKDLQFSNKTDVAENSSLEQSTLEKAADLLKNMSFSSENYKDLLDVINKISSMNGLENLEAPKEEKIEKIQVSDAQQQTNPAEVSNRDARTSSDTDFLDSEKTVPQENTSVNETKPFDPKSPIVYGETVLPSFAVMADGKLQSVENAVVTGYDKSSQIYTIESGTEKMRLPKATLETLLNDKREQEQAQARLAEGKTIVFEDKDRGVKGTVIPEFAMYTQKGLESFRDFVARGFNAAENTYTLSNGESTMTVTAERFKEITAPERFENRFDENSPAWKKLCESQYNDFFRQRENTAYNFRHNLSVYCRKEANSPCDALHLAKDIIQRMPKEEQRKTEKLLKTMAHENESTNELIARLYHESVKEMPLNEDYIKKYQPEKVIVRPFYDTISDNGKKIEDDPSLVKGSSDRNLKIGDTLRDVDIRLGKLFGKGCESMRFDELKVVSASKEGNSITLMDANRSFFKLPRDTVLQAHKEQQLKEMKQEQRHSRANSMSFSYA